MALHVSSTGPSPNNDTVLQSKEVERLNGVYNKLLRGAGVDLIGVRALFSQPLSHIKQLLCTALPTSRDLLREYSKADA